MYFVRDEKFIGNERLKHIITNMLLCFVAEVAGNEPRTLPGVFWNDVFPVFQNISVQIQTFRAVGKFVHHIVSISMQIMRHRKVLRKHIHHVHKFKKS